MNDATGAMNERDAAILEAAERVRAGVAAGASEANALEGVPDEMREEVAATLRTLSRVEGLAEAPSMAFGTRLEASFLEAVDATRARRVAARAPRGWFGAAMLRTAAVLGAVVLAFAGSGLAVQASESAIPGDTLYPVKEAGESVRLFFARGDGLTRLRLAQLARRQAELESALQRGARPRVLMALELSVAASTSHLVDATRRLEAAGNPAPALAAREAVGQMHERIDALTASETRPEVARTLRRMSNFLEGQERELGGATPGATPAPVAPATPALPAGATPTAPPRGEAPGALATPAARPSAITTREVTPTAIAPREATLVATRAPTSVPREVATPVPAPTRVPTRVP